MADIVVCPQSPPINGNEPVTNQIQFPGQDVPPLLLIPDRTDD